MPDPVGLLVCRDLIFTTKVKDTARALGYRLLISSDMTAAKSMIEGAQPRAVFIDLTAGEMAAKSAIIAYRELAGRDAWFVAFGPHVDTEALATASAAGCHLVLPRSKFAAELSAVLHRCYSEPASRDG
jgi:hypothetical protein